MAAPTDRPLPEPLFRLASPGTETVVSYETHGTMTGVDTPEYRYDVTDPEGLARALGEGIPPNRSHESDPAYQLFRSRHPKVDPWRHVQSPSAQDDFYAWCTADDVDPGVRLFYLGEALRRAGLLTEALKAYQAIVVMHPRSVAWSRKRTFYWYVAPEAVSRIRKICATYPQLALRYEGARVDVERAGGMDPARDRVRVSPGRFEAGPPEPTRRETAVVTARRLEGRVRLVQYDGKDWELLVDGRPFLVRGVSYCSTTIGESAHAQNLRPWQTLDDDGNGRNDGMFDSWVDANRNGRRDPDEPVVGDAELLRRMGANAIRVYHGVDARGRYDGSGYDKELMRRLHREYGIYFILGDFLGAYTVGSGADWNLGTDYTSAQQRERMTESVLAMVEDHKQEPYVLMWLLGNENQHPSTRTNAHEHPREYAEFLNEVARRVHEIDPDHPVAVGNLTTVGLEEIGQLAPEIDVYGANVYSGAYSFGSVWQAVRRHFDRPLLFTEMGCDAYAEGRGPDEEAQAEYFLSNWEDIELNRAFGRGEGNAIGGSVFQWMDEWWKSSRGDGWGSPSRHDTDPDTDFASPDGWSHEEWYGIFGQGDGSDSPFLREPRKVYEAIRSRWADGG